MCRGIMCRLLRLIEVVIDVRPMMKDFPGAFVYTDLLLS